MERASSSNRPGHASPGERADAFGLLGLPAQFDLEPAAIEQAYFEKSKELHPDRFASAPAAERVAALSRSRALNDAYQQIKKPVGRAEYLLARAGITIGENERIADAAFLMEILELREELAEARAAKRTSEVQKLCEDMQARRKGVVGKLSPLFASNDLPAIKDQLIVLRYLDRYLEECDAALDED